VSRNEETLQPTVYLNKLPDAFAPDARVLVTDPMLATGARERLAVAAGCSS
jgi:uracil phosphoribosyltransferase